MMNRNKNTIKDINYRREVQTYSVDKQLLFVYTSMRFCCLKAWKKTKIEIESRLYSTDIYEDDCVTYKFN